MDIKPVKFLKSFIYANKSAQMGKLENHIDIVGEFGDYARMRLQECYPSLEQFAAHHGLKLKLAQKDNLLLISSGGGTTYLDMKKMERASDFQRAIYDNMRAGYKRMNILKK